jgi:MHS family proline/betaine transporter-like MFS transporter
VYIFRLLQEVRPDGDFGFVPILVNGIVVLFLPIFGYISDFFERKYFVAISSLLTGIYILNCLGQIIRLDDMNLLIVGIIIYSLLNAAMTAAINIFVVELFPAKFRMSCSGLFYSLGMGFVGGTVPMVAAYMMRNYEHGVMYIAYYLSSVCVIGAMSVGLLAIKRRVLKYKQGYNSY